jgi:hypothetical protein
MTVAACAVVTDGSMGLQATKALANSDTMTENFMH